MSGGRGPGAHVRHELDLFTRNLAVFSRILHSTGLYVGPHRLDIALRAVEALGLESREAMYWALRSTLTSGPDQAAPFDLAFTAFFDRSGAPPQQDDARDEPDDEVSTTSTDGDGDQDASAAPEAAGASSSAPDTDHGEQQGASWSAQEQLRHLDFALYSDEDLRAARHILRHVVTRVPMRRTRRTHPSASGDQLDWRATLRAASRTEGHPLQRSWRETRHTPRRLLFLIDVSGSMQPYARVLLLFAQVVRRSSAKVEVYSFGTRLTRLTAALAGRDAARSLRAAADTITDWSGGTRIGDNIQRLNQVARQRALTRGAVTIVFSDGCERGDPDLLAREMSLLHRSAHSVVWVNPLAGDPRYEPRTRGMLAALPFIDVLLPGHDLAAIEHLAAVLDAVPPRRSPTASPSPTQ